MPPESAALPLRYHAGLDTSVVLRLLVGEPAEQAVQALNYLASHRAKGRICSVNDIVVTEAYYALCSYYAVPKREALKLLLEFLTSGEVQPLGRALQVLEQSLASSSKPGFVDRLIHANYQSDKAGLVTFEKAAGRLPGALVLTG
jgi:predicted nucleic acid-binding protein